jgi:uncharacterized membrane protein YdbT with pleckstrin-like domain
MSYVEQVLQSGETVKLRTNLHWFVYLPALLAFIATVGLGAWWYQDGQTNFFLAIGSLVVLAAAILLGISGFLKRFGTEIAVTPLRVIYKRGLIRRSTTEINMDKIESVDVDQSIFGRLFSYGTVTIRGTGEAVEPIRDIADPIAFRNAIMVR